MRTNLISRRPPGFTLLELMVVIVILGFLSVLGVSGFRSSQQKSRDTKRKSDLAQIAKALEYYANDLGVYPLASADGKIISKNSAGNIVTYQWGSPFTNAIDNRTVYMQMLPKDSSPYSYRYGQITGGKGYQLYAHIESTFDADYDANLTVMCGSKKCTYVLRSSNLTPTPTP